MAQGLTHKIFYAIAKRYRHSPVSRWIVLVADMMSLVLSFAIAAVFALHDQGWQIEWVPLMTQLFGCLTMTTILFFVTGTGPPSSRWWRSIVSFWTASAVRLTTSASSKSSWL